MAPRVTVLESFHSKLHGSRYMASYWTTIGIQLVFLWNAWSQNEENVKYVSVDTTKHMIHTDIPHSTHNCIPHNLYYTTYYPWRVAVRITVMCVMWN